MQIPRRDRARSEYGRTTRSSLPPVRPVSGLASLSAWPSHVREHSGYRGGCVTDNHALAYRCGGSTRWPGLLGVGVVFPV